MRASTEHTELTSSEGMPAISKQVMGRPSCGTRKRWPTVWWMLSSISREANMKR